MNHKRVLQYLYSLESPKIKLGLGRVQTLLDKAGNPEKNLKCIHVAGTNGKGSVCAMVFHILKEAGYRVGLYTSPHLKRFNERIRINNNLVTDKEIVEYFLKVRPYITDQSFFEITTAMAFLYFKEKNVDYVVLEVGLGGRLDATNVINPLVSIITNIGLEHTELLGNTIEKVAFEKAGIIKNNAPVIAGAKGKALKIIKKIAREKNSPFFRVKGFDDAYFKYLYGKFQQENKDTALTAIKILKQYYPLKINELQIKNGIEKTKWPARLQFISRNVLVDCAHNADGFNILKKELIVIKKQKKIKNFIFVVGILKDKDVKAMLRTINPLISSIIFTKSKNEKSAEPKQLLKIFNKINKNKKINIKTINNPKKALNYAKKIAKKGDLVVVAGSIYMVGEII